MKTISINLYSFKELSKEAQNKALSKYATINVDFDWWDSTYNDAEQVGLKITGFDLDRNKHATGQLTLNALEVAQNIINNHGENCNTYKTAQKFLEEHAPIFADYMDENSDGYESAENEGKLSDLESGFLEDLLSDYADMLQKECDYLMSKEAIIETFEANDYTFEADGKMNNAKPEQEKEEDKKMAIHLLKLLEEDCNMGMSGEWDCSTDEGKKGFESMIDSIDNIKDIIEKHI
jgi:hypothetical protein